jgi:hypothetical protein
MQRRSKEVERKIKCKEEQTGGRRWDGGVWCKEIISSAPTLQIIIKAWFNQEFSMVHLIHVECGLYHLLETLHIVQQVCQRLDEHATQCRTVIVPT